MIAAQAIHNFSIKLSCNVFLSVISLSSSSIVEIYVYNNVIKVFRIQLAKLLTIHGVIKYVKIVKITLRSIIMGIVLRTVLRRKVNNMEKLNTKLADVLVVHAMVICQIILPDRPAQQNIVSPVP